MLFLRDLFCRAGQRRGGRLSGLHAQKGQGGEKRQENSEIHQRPYPLRRFVYRGVEGEQKGETGPLVKAIKPRGLEGKKGIVA